MLLPLFAFAQASPDEPITDAERDAIIAMFRVDVDTSGTIVSGTRLTLALSSLQTSCTGTFAECLAVVASERQLFVTAVAGINFPAIGTRYDGLNQPADGATPQVTPEDGNGERNNGSNDTGEALIAAGVIGLVYLAGRDLANSP